MAAAEVLAVDKSFIIPRHQRTQRIERILEQWYNDLKANVVVSMEETHFVLHFENRQTTRSSRNFSVISKKEDEVKFQVLEFSHIRNVFGRKQQPWTFFLQTTEFVSRCIIVNNPLSVENFSFFSPKVQQPLSKIVCLT